MGHFRHVLQPEMSPAEKFRRGARWSIQTVLEDEMSFLAAKNEGLGPFLNCQLR